MFRYNRDVRDLVLNVDAKYFNPTSLKDELPRNVW